jgi:hypothetical protein
MDFPKADNVSIFRVFEVRKTTKEICRDFERPIYSWRADICLREDAEIFIRSVETQIPGTVLELYYLRDGNFNDEAERIHIENVCPKCQKPTKTILDNMVGKDFLCESCGSDVEGTGAHKRRAARLAMEFYSEGADNGKI